VCNCYYLLAGCPVKTGSRLLSSQKGHLALQALIVFTRPHILHNRSLLYVHNNHVRIILHMLLLKAKMSLVNRLGAVLTLPRQGRFISKPFWYGAALIDNWHECPLCPVCRMAGNTV